VTTLEHVAAQVARRHSPLHRRNQIAIASGNVTYCFPRVRSLAAFGRRPGYQPSRCEAFVLDRADLLARYA
jgi:hypothetical protein